MIKLRSVMYLIVYGVWMIYASPCAHAVESNKEFEDFFQKVIDYHPEIDFPIEDHKEKKTYYNNIGKDIVPTLIALSNNNIHMFTDKLKVGNLTMSRLEQLFYENLGTEAEKICEHFSKTSELPSEINILRQIFHGVEVPIQKGQFSEDYLKVAYRVANQAHNYTMVEQLFTLAGIKALENAIMVKSSETFSPKFNYIHEPYWNYNIIQLQEYGQRIIEKIKPHMINSDQINETGIKIGNEIIKVRKIENGFGRILPNLYLQRELAHNENLGVPRIFVLQSHPNTPVNLVFRMPYEFSRQDKITKHEGVNPIQVFCDDFIVYQEFIEGSGKSGDEDFASYGHRDLNHVQIIKSKSGKKYLIDSKEAKNFPVPFLSFSKEDMSSEEINKHQTVLFEAKSLNFDPRVIFVPIKLKPIH